MINPFVFFNGDKLFDADWRTKEQALFGFNEAGFVKVEDLPGYRAVLSPNRGHSIYLYPNHK